MKYIWFMILLFSMFSQAQAWLFEYTQWEKTRINSTKFESADIVESINIPNNNHWFSSSINNNYNTSTSYYHTSISPTIFADDYYKYNNIWNTSYNSDDIFSEMQYYISLANGIRNDISKMRKYGSEYTALRNQLKRDLSDLENQIDYLSNLRKNIAQNNIYYSHHRLYRNSTRSQKLVNYYRKYGYEYQDSSYYYFDSQYNYYQRQPSWINENLRPRDEWYIYIQ